VTLRECRFLGIEERGYRYAAGSIGRIIAEGWVLLFSVVEKQRNKVFLGEGEKEESV